MNDTGDSTKYKDPHMMVVVANREEIWDYNHKKVHAESNKDGDNNAVQLFLSQYQNQGKTFTRVHETIDVEACCDIIDENQITFVLSGTATGKSSLVPRGILKRNPEAKIVVAVPRRSAAINLALRVAHLDNQKIGEQVGYRVKGEYVGDDNLPLMYMSSYILLLYLLSHTQDFKYSYIILDEFHERQADIEVLLALLRLAITEHKELLHLKIILMSASSSLDYWKEYFKGIKVGLYDDTNSRYTVNKYFADDVSKIINIPMSSMSNSATVDSLVYHQIKFYVKELLKFLINTTLSEHAILVFLPGRSAISFFTKFLIDNFYDKAEPIAWYRDIELNEVQIAIEKKATSGRKKIYLATDIAEVSITIPDLVFIIDTGICKKPKINENDSRTVLFPPLTLLWISPSAFKQRMGRVGRLQQGFIFTMISENQLDQLMELEAQIANTRINELCLHILGVIENPFKVFDLCRVTPKKKSVQLSLDILIGFGFILPHTFPGSKEESVTNLSALTWANVINKSTRNRNSSKYIVTIKGFLSQYLPFNIEWSSLIYYGLLVGLESLCILTACIGSCGIPFYSSPSCTNNKSNASDKFKLETKMKSFLSMNNTRNQSNLPYTSDIVASAYALISFKIFLLSGPSTLLKEEWCNSHSVVLSRINTILQLEEHTKKQLSQQIAFVDINNPTILQNQLNKHWYLISIFTTASQLDRGVYVKHDYKTQQRKKFAGSSIFFDLRMQKDENTGTVVNWSKGSIIVPMHMQFIYDRLLGSNSNKHTPEHYNLCLIIFSYTIHISSKLTDNRVRQDCNDYLHVSLTLYSKKLIFTVNKQTMSLILSIRQHMSMQSLTLRVLKESGLSPLDSELIQIKKEEMINSLLTPKLAEACLHAHGPSLPINSASSTLLDQLTEIFKNTGNYFINFADGDITPELVHYLGSTSPKAVPYSK